MGGAKLATNLAANAGTNLATGLAGDVSPFAHFPSVTAHWDPAYGRTMGTGVASWTDRIGLNVVSEATGSQQPAFNATGGTASGIASLGFTAASSQLLTGAVSLATECAGGEFAIFAGFRTAGSDPGSVNVGGWGSSGTGNHYAKILLGGADYLNGRYRATGDISLAGTATLYPADHWISLANTGTTAYHATDVDAEQTGDSTGVSVTAPYHFVIGSEPDASPSGYWEGELTDFVVCSLSAGTAAERAAISAVIATRAGI